jgi:hypothetical protein
MEHSPTTFRNGPRLAARTDADSLRAIAIRPLVEESCSFGCSAGETEILAGLASRVHRRLRLALVSATMTAQAEPRRYPGFPQRPCKARAGGMPPRFAPCLWQRASIKSSGAWKSKKFPWNTPLSQSTTRFRFPLFPASSLRLLAPTGVECNPPPQWAMGMGWATIVAGNKHDDPNGNH